MAWPLTPFRSMNNGTTVWDDLLGNALQAGVNGIVAGTYSLLGVVTDGIGGVASAPVAGAVKVSAVGGSAAALPNTTAKAALYKDLIPVAGGMFSVTGAGVIAFQWGWGVSSIVRAAAGNFNITLLNALVDAAHALPLVVSNASGPLSASAAYLVGLMSSPTVLNVQISTAPNVGGSVDSSFAFVLFGQPA